MTKNRKAKSIARTRAGKTGEKYTAAHAATSIGFADDPEATNAQHLVTLVRQGAERRYGTDLPATVRTRLNDELAYIRTVGFVDHYLTMHAIVEAAEREDVVVGPGRGTAAGSIILYVLGVTAVDPIATNLLFDLFISQGRNNFPEVGLPVGRGGDKLHGFISSTWRSESPRWFEEVVDLGAEPLTVQILRLAHIDIVTDTVQLIEQRTGTRIDASALLAHTNMDDSRVRKTWDAIANGDTNECFCLDSAGVQGFAARVKPGSLHDLAATIALFRPAPLEAGLTDLFAGRASGDLLDYSEYTTDPAERAVIASILDDTRGVWTYLEQLMRLGTAVAGLDIRGRGILRRAVAKKDGDLWTRTMEDFRSGALRDTAADGSPKLAFSEETTAKIVDSINRDAPSLFTAAHAYPFAQVAFATAYLKTNWPAEFAEASTPPKRFSNTKQSSNVRKRALSA
ncbi:hypothetical protein [Leifsonia sp. Leaf264]|uniref:hypothetical protein n=1 Tax=Leifsonia sp. Leaf264 TaxID=1736314 RepID=UPI0006F954A8|nr:hypothetical protein [Leifsonia sp. Leaf264]KQO98370.1 hypothetical protein ASF30_09935 [Leifsonia sp. Leaf264]